MFGIHASECVSSTGPEVLGDLLFPVQGTFSDAKEYSLNTGTTLSRFGNIPISFAGEAFPNQALRSTEVKRSSTRDLNSRHICV